MSGTRASRLLNGIAGQASGRVMVAVFQLAIMPVMIHAWGLALYGEWLLVTGVATYLAVSNHGLTSASAMAIIRHGAQGDHAAANRITATSLSAVLAVTTVITLAAAAAMGLSRLPQALSIASLKPYDLVAITLACGVQVCAASARTLPIAVSEAQGHYGKPQLLSSAIRLVEFAGTVMLVLSGFTPVVIAGWMATIVVADWLAQVMLARHWASWARFSPAVPDVRVLADLARPSAGHTVISVAVNALSIQGARMVVGATLGPAAVGALSIYTSVTRVTDHLAAMVLPVLQLEFARQPDGTHENARAIGLIGLTQTASLIILAGYTGIAALSGDWIFRMLSAGHVPFNLVLFLLFSLVCLCVQFGRGSLTYLMGRNRVGTISVTMLLGWMAALAMTIPLASWLGIAGVAVALVMGELCASMAALVIAARHFGLSPRSYAALLFSIRPMLAVIGRLLPHSSKRRTA